MSGESECEEYVGGGNECEECESGGNECEECVGVVVMSTRSVWEWWE